MRDSLTSLLNLGESDMRATQGATCVVTRRGVQIGSGQGVITGRAETYTLELGGGVYEITADCAMAKTAFSAPPQGGDMVQSGGLTYQIQDVQSLVIEGVYHMSLAKKL